ncbi:hypothetical protein HHI36_001732 [Cryptolaemus montrouzieri]|uniref:Uncharacterized protein n=1 Tax=Cryptolaemus montrouzieri TaxID=559131 RepID=A0ABD2P9S8_9CUCU
MSLNRFLDKFDHEKQFDFADISINHPIDDSEEETDEEEDDYSLEEDDEPACKKVRKSEVPRSISTVKGQGKNGNGKKRSNNGDFANDQVTNNSADIEGIEVKSPLELFELFWDVDLFEYVKDQTNLYATEKNQ